MFAKLDVKALGLAFGIVWGAAMLVLGLMNITGAWGSGIMQAMSTLYLGYKPTIPGSIIGGVWGFLDAGIGGVLVGWLYNRFQK